MRRLLDDELLAGAHEVVISLRPYRALRPVHTLDDAVRTATLLCQVWGGTGAPLVSTASGKAPEYLIRAAIQSDVDGFIGDLSLPAGTERFLEDIHNAWDYPAALIAAHMPRRDFVPIEVVDLDADDPWRLAYLGVLGTLPDELDESLRDAAGLERLRHHDVFPVRRVNTRGSIEDLIERLEPGKRHTPREMSSFFLGVGQDPNTGYYGGRASIPDRWASAQAAGPNIIVVMSPDDVDDFALLWNLRGMWGDQRAMPIGVPRDHFDRDLLQRLHQPGVTTFFGWSGGHLYLTSASLTREQLADLAALRHGVQVAEPEHLLRLGAAPSRPHRTVQDWSDGAASIVPMTDEDRRVLSQTSHRRPSLLAAVHVPSRPVPALGSLRSQFMGGMAGGAVPLQIPHHPQRNGTIDVRWPSGWTALTAAAEDRSLEVRPSQPGLAAMAVLRALGDPHQAYFLSDPAIVTMLYALAELSGMSWWKRRWKRVESALRREGQSEPEIEQLAQEQGRDEPVIAPPHEGRTLTFSAIKARIGDRAATEKWITWALERRLLVKGVELSCKDCRTPFWIPVAELAPPYVCPGCGRTITQPFGADTLVFSYRLGEVLRRCLELDALGHVLALRWLVDLFDGYGLVGVHPGVEFTQDGTVLAEVDVVVLLGDGALVPVEVKRRAASFDSAASAQLDHISNLLGAPFDSVAVLQFVDAGDEIHSHMREQPDRPRFLLSSEHFGMSHVMWGLGANPFSPPKSEGDLAVRQHREWVRATAAMGNRPIDPFAETVSFLRDKRREKI